MYDLFKPRRVKEREELKKEQQKKDIEQIEKKLREEGIQDFKITSLEDRFYDITFSLDENLNLIKSKDQKVTGWQIVESININQLDQMSKIDPMGNYITKRILEI